jgi:uncharacterized delta-60 repeat protein
LFLAFAGIAFSLQTECLEVRVDATKWSSCCRNSRTLAVFAHAWKNLNKSDRGLSMTTYHFAKRFCAALFLSLSLVPNAAFAAPGDVDTSYGVNGYFLSAAGDEAVASLVQPDGKLVFVGRCPVRNGAFSFCITRLTTTGVLDTSFGPLPTPSGRIVVQAGDTNSQAERATAVTRQVDGKIVVGGDCSVGAAQQLCFLRYDANGVLDTSFGTSGKAHLAKATGGAFGSPGPSTLAAMKALAGGQILFAGSWTAGLGDTRPMVGRLAGNGTIDISFAAPSGFAIVNTSGTNGSNQMNALAVRADNRIVAVGSCERLFFLGTFGDPNYFTAKACLWFLNADGTPDASFPPNFGSTTIDGSSGPVADNSLNAVAIRPDGAIVAGGTCGTTSAPSMCYVYFDLSQLLTGSGTSGTTNKFSANALAVSTDGGVNFFGTQTLTASTSNMALGRLNSDLSTLLAGSAATPVASGYNSGDAGGGLQPDGKLLIVGNCGTATIRSCATRLLGFPSGGARCSLDIDGDGNYTSTIDGLIATRVMLGLTDTGVTGGITIPSSAPRKTWPEIRQFLVSQCGMQLP